MRDQFSVGCADGGAQARSSQVHASKLPEDNESSLFQKSDDIDTAVRETNEGFICLLRNGHVENRVLNKTDEHVIAYNSRKNAKVNMPSITISDWARLVPPKDNTPDTFGQ